MKIAVLGVAGRMGQALVRRLCSHPELSLDCCGGATRAVTYSVKMPVCWLVSAPVVSASAMNPDCCQSTGGRTAGGFLDPTRVNARTRSLCGRPVVRW